MWIATILFVIALPVGWWVLKMFGVVSFCPLGAMKDHILNKYRVWK
jgi:hypothetical protein